jgi:DNA (cytosine-5)-methyltransferase 1
MERIVKGLVLSLFPGIGLLDMAFEEAGFCVVRGPDLLWGGDVRGWKIAPNRFDGIIGGPPCKRFSPLANVVRAVHGEDAVAPDLIPDFVNLIEWGMPAWFLMENVPLAPVPQPKRFNVREQIIRDVWVGGATNRERRFTFGALNAQTVEKWQIDTLALHAIKAMLITTGSSGVRFRRWRLIKAFRTSSSLD